VISVDGQVTDRLEYVRKTQEMLGQLRERGTSSAATNAMQMADDLVSLYARLDGDKQIVKGLVMELSQSPNRVGVVLMAVVAALSKAERELCALYTWINNTLDEADAEAEKVSAAADEAGV